MTTSSALPTILGIFGLPGGAEWVILLVIGLLVFGRRLPEVGRSLGRSIVEFKKGIRGIDDEINDEVQRRPDQSARLEDQTQSDPYPKSSAAVEEHNPYAASKGNEGSS